MSLMFTAYSEFNDGMFLSGKGGEDRTFEVIAMLAASEEGASTDKKGVAEQFFANKNAPKPATPEEEKDAIGFAATLARTKRVDVYNLTQDERGRTQLTTTSHVVGFASDGKTYAMVTDEGQTVRFQNEGNTVVHEDSKELVTAIGTTYLGNPNLYEQVDKCCLIGFDRAFDDLPE